MYSSFFKFSEKPFEVTPDPKYFYASPSHKEMLASLVYGIGERRGFICLTGEVGTGKTMLINSALDRFDDSTKVAYISNTALTFNQLLLVTLEELEILEQGKQISKLKSIRLLNEFALGKLSEGGNVVLIFDEAQNLDADSMENLRLLSNLETRKHKLIQIVLAGQPELDAKLDCPELRQLAQRISVRRLINPLSEEETYAYILHRLTVAGCREPELFRIEARKMIYECSGGIPRKINILCDNALLIGYALKKTSIDSICVAEAAADLKWAQFFKPVEPGFSTVPTHNPQLENRLNSRIAVAVSMALAAGLVIGAWHILGLSGSTFSVTPSSLSESGVQARINLSQHLTEHVSTHEANGDFPKLDSMEGVADLKVVTSSSLDNKWSTEQAAPLVSSSELTEQKVAFHTGTSSELEATSPIKNDVAEKAELAPTNTVVVERDDYLRKIIQRAYGKCNESLMAKVLKVNPEIRTADQIFVGQVIRLPEIDPK